MVEIIPNWHPIFVHFTVALYSVATLFFLLSHITSNQSLQSQWYNVAKWNLWLGAAITVLTVVAGIQAYNTVDHDTPSHLAMTDHRNWAIGTAAFFLVLAVWSFIQDRAGKTRNWLFVGLLVLASAALASTAWHGGEVVYRYGLGVMSLPKVDGEGHAHEHPDGTGHGHSDSIETMDESMPAKVKNESGDEHHDDGHHDDHGEPGHHDNDKKEDSKSKTPSDHHDDGHDHTH